MNNSLISKIYFPHCLFFSKIIYLLKLYICWLNAIRLGSSCETQITNNTDRNCVNKQNTHTHQTLKKDNTGKG